MRPIRVGGRRVICPICRRRYATAHVFGTIACGKCVRGLFIGFMAGNNHAWNEIHEKYEIKRKEEKDAADCVRSE